MSDLVAIAYEDLSTAQQVASNLGEAVKGHDIELDDLVIVERKDDGKVKLHQPSLVGLDAEVRERRPSSRCRAPSVLPSTPPIAAGGPGGTAGGGFFPSAGRIFNPSHRTPS